METQPLTAWEAKERAGLLALETKKRRKRRRVAEDPNTTADVLEQLTHVVWEELGFWLSGEPMGNHRNVRVNTLLLAEPIVAHPNTPPRALKRLLERVFDRELGELSLITKAFCRNPLLPLLTLEMPDFWMNLDGDVCKALLCEEALPPSAVCFLTEHKGSRMGRDENGVATPLKDHSVAEAARLHISQVPLPQTPSEGCKALTAFWKNYCAQQQQDPDYVFKRGYTDEWHAEMVEVGLAPAWMTPFYKDVPPSVPPPPENIYKWGAANPEYAPFLHSDTSPEDLMHTARTIIKDDNAYYEAVYLLLLRHPRTTVEIIRYIAGKHPQKELRLHLAAHPLTPTDVLAQMVNVPLQSSWVEDWAQYEALRAENALTRRLACWHPNAPADLTAQARQVFLKATQQPYQFTSLPLVDFITALRAVYPVEILTDRHESAHWVYSLIAALYLPLTNTPLDELGRSPLDLMHHLAHDGNRFVRWAAQTRLADPDFVFTWQE